MERSELLIVKERLSYQPSTKLLNMSVLEAGRADTRQQYFSGWKKLMEVMNIYLMFFNIIFMSYLHKLSR